VFRVTLWPYSAGILFRRVPKLCDTLRLETFYSVGTGFSCCALDCLLGRFVRFPHVQTSVSLRWVWRFVRGVLVWLFFGGGAPLSRFVSRFPFRFSQTLFFLFWGVFSWAVLFVAWSIFCRIFAYALVCPDGSYAKPGTQEENSTCRLGPGESCSKANLRSRDNFSSSNAAKRQRAYFNLAPFPAQAIMLCCTPISSPKWGLLYMYACLRDKPL
jgi:hypothetical protein